MKKLITIIINLMLVFNNTMVFADVQTKNAINDLESMEVTDLLTDSRFQDLNFDMESIAFFSEIQLTLPIMIGGKINEKNVIYYEFVDSIF